MDDSCVPHDCAIHQYSRRQTSHNSLQVSTRNTLCHVRNALVGEQLSDQVLRRGLRGSTPTHRSDQSKYLQFLSTARTLRLRALSRPGSPSLEIIAGFLWNYVVVLWRLAMISSYVRSDSLSIGLPISPHTGHSARR